jgi:hypothetical protein
MTIAAVEPGTFDVAPHVPFGAGTRRKWGLRRRILLIFTLGALMLSLVLAFVTYGFARSSVVQQRDNDARAATRRNASIVVEALRGNPANAQPAMTRLEDLGVPRPLVWYNGDWTPGRTGYDETDLPQALVDKVIADGVPRLTRHISSSSVSTRSRTPCSRCASRWCSAP